MKHHEFSSAQWKFIAALEALGVPSSLELLGQLVPLTPGPLVNLITCAEERGWVRQEEDHILSLAPDIPPEIHAKLARINTREQTCHLLKRFRTIKPPPPGHVTMEANLLERSGQLYEAAQFEYHAATDLMESGDLHAAMTTTGRVITRITPALLNSDLRSLYIQAVLFYDRLSYILGENICSTLKILRSALGIAEEIGDRRSLALIRMHIGIFHYLHDDLDAALKFLRQGLDKAAALGDNDILIQSAEFEGMYFFIQGLYPQACEAFERAIESSSQRRDHLVNFYLPIFLGQSAAILGRFHRAIGILDSNLRKARIEGEDERATLYEAMLGMVLLRMGRRDDALHHLLKTQNEARWQKNDRALYFAQRGIVYYYYLEGRLKEVEKLVQDMYFDVDHLPYSWPTGPQYIWPIILEIIFALIRRGFKPPSWYDAQADIQKILNGPNYNLKGALYRLQALDAVRRNRDRETVKTLLVKSEENLLHSADPLELAKTHMELARFELKNNNPVPARQYALKAWEEMSGHWENLFPGDLRMLVKSGDTDVQNHNSDAILDGFLDLLDAFVPSNDEEELLNRLMSATCHFFGAERGALFWLDEQSHTMQPRMRAAYNLLTSDIEDALFKRNLGLIKKVLRNKQPLLIYSPESASTRIICLPIEIQGELRGVMYHENMYISHGFQSFDRKLLIRISRHVSAYIERIGAYCRLIKETSIQASQQSELKISHADGDIVVNCEGMRELLHKADQVAVTDASVLILGETGVGKEVLARRVHAVSRRSSGPFIAVDLTSIPENLLESELFGHEKGAFTGADQRKPGRMELADKGTLFIDEIGDISLSVQVKLLRAIQERSFVRVGGTKTLHPDFRFIAATNRDLAREVEKGTFREDLYYRLNVVQLDVPPIRDRGDDAVLLARHFLACFGAKYSRNQLNLSENDKIKIRNYTWPGNVRELKNAMERTAILSSPGKLDLVLPEISCPENKKSFSDNKMPTLEELERQHIKHVLSLTRGKMGGKKGAACLLGVKRTTLYARMKKLGIS